MKSLHAKNDIHIYQFEIGLVIEAAINIETTKNM